MKGILSIAHAEQRFVYHAVHMLFSGAFDDAWEDGEPRNSKMVFIGRNLDPKALADRFNACLVTKESLEAKAARLRFALGDRVECNAGEWVTGTVVAHFYRDENMPQGMVAPYQIRLDDDDGLIWAPKDHDCVIRRLVEDGTRPGKSPRPQGDGAGPSGAPPGATGANAHDHDHDVSIS